MVRLITSLVRILVFLLVLLSGTFALSPSEKASAKVVADGIQLRQLHSVFLSAQELAKIQELSVAQKLATAQDFFIETDFVPWRTQKISGLWAIPYQDFARGRGLKFASSIDSLFGLRLKLYISDEYQESLKTEGGISYACSLNPVMLRRFSLKNLPRNTWVDVYLWFPLAKSGERWDIFLQMLNFDPAVFYQGVFIHELSLLSFHYGEKTKEQAILQALDAHRAWLDSPVFGALLMVFLGCYLFFPLWRCSHRISWRVLSIFILPFFLALAFFLVQMRHYFDHMLEAELYAAEQRLKRALQEVLDSGDNFDALVFQEIEYVKKTIKQYVEQHYSDIDFHTFQPELEQVLQTEATSRYLWISIHNGHHAYYSPPEEERGGLVRLKPLSHLLQGIFRKNILEKEKEDRQKRRQAWEPLMEVIRLCADSLSDDRLIEYYLNNPNRLFDFDIRQESVAGFKGTGFWSYFVTEGENPILWYLNGNISGAGPVNYMMRALENQSAVPHSRLSEIDIYLDSFRMDASCPEQNINRFHFPYFGAYGKLSSSYNFSVMAEDEEISFYYTGPFPFIREYSLVLRMDGQPIFAKIRYYKNLAGLFFFIVVLGFGLISFVFAKQITSTFFILEKGLKRIENGDLSSDLLVRGRDQLAEITVLFNRMLVGLREKKRIAPFLSAMAHRSLDDQALFSVREQAVVLFYGIKNLAEFSKTEQPQLLEQFLAAAQDIVQDYNGYIDKFTGLAVLAVFRGEKRGSQALNCALQLRENFSITPSMKRVKCGLGIASGPLVLGNVGSPLRKDYTAIGNTVNVAARLENLPADKSFSIFFADELLLLLNASEQQYDYKRHEAIYLKGKTEPLTVYEIL